MTTLKERLEKKRDVCAAMSLPEIELTVYECNKREEYYKKGFNAASEMLLQMAEALHKLNNEVAAMVATHGDAISRDYGNTNLECLNFRLDQARKTLNDFDNWLGER